MTKATGRRPGRPVTTGTKPTRTMRLGPVYDRAREIAEQRGESLAVVVVEPALAAYVAEHEDARSTSRSRG